MLKIISFIILSLSVQCFATNYYVGVTASGSGNASSWANKDDAATFHFTTLSAGDIVYLDGGTDTLLYDNQQIIINDNGTSGSRITITRGIDAGHNGKPVFRYTTSAGNRVLDVSGNYVTVSYLQFMGGTSATDYSYETTWMGGDYNIIEYCTIYHPINKGIRVRANHLLISHNLIVGNLGSLSGADTDNIHIDGSSKNIEIAYNTLLEMGNNPSNGAHTDNIQSYLWQDDDDGVSSIHHNFIAALGTSMVSLSLMDGGAIGGELRIYNNVWVDNTNQNSSRRINITNCGGNTTGGNNWVVKFFNNTCYFPNTTGGGIAFDTGDSLFVYNNIVYTYGNDFQVIMADGLGTGDDLTKYVAMDNNIYVRTRSDAFGRMNCSSNAHETFTQWKSTYSSTNTDINSYDSNSSTYLTWVGTLPSYDPQDYALQSGSNGVDDGETLTGTRDWGFVTDDFNGNPRTGTWDVGAFEYGASPPATTKKVRVIIIQ